MATDLSDRQRLRSLDLTGLPEPVVEQVTRLVQEARDKQAQEGTGTNGTHPAAEDLDSGTFPMFISRPQPSLEESRRLLDEMAAMGTGQSLPADWSRADLYDDHD
jgi:hypothetical protein